MHGQAHTINDAGPALVPYYLCNYCLCYRELQEPDAVKFWTDYLTAKLHPSTVWQLPGISQGLSDFQGYGLGRVQGSNSETQEEVAERVRLFAEECDSLQASCLCLGEGLSLLLMSIQNTKNCLPNSACTGYTDLGRY